MTHDFFQKLDSSIYSKLLLILTNNRKINVMTPAITMLWNFLIEFPGKYSANYRKNWLGRLSPRKYNVTLLMMYVLCVKGSSSDNDRVKDLYETKLRKKDTELAYSFQCSLWSSWQSLKYKSKKLLSSRNFRISRKNIYITNTAWHM